MIHCHKIKLDPSRVKLINGYLCSALIYTDCTNAGKEAVREAVTQA